MAGKNVALVMLILVGMTFHLVGCSGGSSSPGSVVQTETPEVAVSRIFDSWRADGAPVFNIGGDGSIAAQTTTSTDRYIRFRDLSGKEWQLKVLDVVYSGDSNATVNTQYTSELNSTVGGLKIGFNMIKDAGVWSLAGLTVTELPVVVVEQYGVKGIIVDKITGLPVSGARVEAYNAVTGVIAGYTVTDSTGFYQILELSPATYYLVINRSGYEPYTIAGITVK